MAEMTEERFATIVAAYGSDPARWPPREQEAARHLVVRQELGAPLAAARALDFTLDGLPAPAPADAALHHRLLAIPETAWQTGIAGWLRVQTAMLETLLAPRLLLGETAALAAALALGLWFGANTIPAAAEAVDLSPYVLGGEIDMWSEDAQ